MRSKTTGQLRRGIRLAQLELLAAMDGHTATLTAAARLVGLAQPAASRLLRELEERTDLELFEKFGRTLRPTRVGRLLMNRAARLVADLDRLEEELQAVDRGLVGTVSIGAGAAPCYSLVPQAIAGLGQRNLKIFIKLQEGGMEELIEGLRAGQIDLVVGRIEYSNRHRDLELESLYDPPMRIVCGSNHPLSRKRAVSLVEAIQGSWLLPQDGTAMRRGIESLFRTENVWPTECLLESSSIQANVAMLNFSNVLWVLSADIAPQFARTKQLTILPVPQLKGPGPIMLASLKDRAPSASVRRVQQSLKAAAKNLAQTMQSSIRSH
jgi:DNA-binding transcriptional LysR family regulator